MMILNVSHILARENQVKIRVRTLYCEEFAGS